MPSTIINPRVVDLSHHNTPTSFGLAFSVGIRGIIHKATEGTTNADPTYSRRRELASRAGMLWGAYHFFRPGPVGQQVDWFLAHANPDANTLLCLDHEDPACTIGQVVNFLEVLERRTGRRGVLYSGHLVKEQLGDVVSPYLSHYRLWHAQYGTIPVVQATWNDWWLWQYTGDGVGPPPHDIAGLGENLDVNSFAGTEAELRAQWTRDVLTLVSKPAVPQSKPSVVSLVQAGLDTLGSELAVDGQLGPQTDRAIRDFQSRHSIFADGRPNRQTVAALLQELQHWNSLRT